jgi:hypothetical protein
MWNPAEHTDEENLRWSWLRAVEWGRWPIFVSQIYAPILLLFLPWPAVVIAVIISNILWALVIRYHHVSVGAASMAAVLTRLKWVICPITAIYLLASGNIGNSVFALLWPLVIFVIGIVPTVQVGKIQKMFMAQLGYEVGAPPPTAPSPPEQFAGVAESQIRPEAQVRSDRSAKVITCIQTVETDLLKRTLSDSEENSVAELCRGLLSMAMGDEKIVIRLVKLEWTDSSDVVDAFRRAQDRWQRDHNRFV